MSPRILSLTITSLVGVLALTLTAFSLQTAEDQDLDIQNVRKHGERILASDADFERIRNNQWDPLGKEYLAFLRTTGKEMLALEPLTHDLQGMRMLHVSRRFLKRVSTWSMLYRVDGDPAFKDRAIVEMEAVAAFADWNPQHFLDIGEMTLGLSIGLDWLWNDLTPKQRDRFLDAIIEKGINPSLDETDPNNWWVYYTNNWNPVCHSGLVAGAILIAEKDPDLAERVIKRAIKATPIAMDEMNPDGVYPEGPVYWGYGAHFSAVLIDLLEHAFGTSYGLADHEGFRESAIFRSLAVSPTGLFYNFYDNSERARFSPVTAWFATQYGMSAAANEMRRGLRDYLDEPDWTAEGADGRNLPFVALWYPDDVPGEANVAPPLSWFGDGPNPIAIVRENWDDENSFYLGFKGGRGTISHAHMDAGSFVFEDDGVRWAVDLGPQNYLSIESKGLGIWDRRQHADRWRVFRIGPYSHNILLLDQRLQNVDAEAKISSFSQEGSVVTGTVDLSDVYAGQVDSYVRSFAVHNNEVLQVTDVIRGARRRTERQGRMPGTLRWRMVTRADIELGEDYAALKQDGKTLHVQIVDPAAFTLRGDSIDPPPYYWDEPNPGVRALDLWSKVDTAGTQTVTVLMSTNAEALTSVKESL